ncbi:MAG: 30S ribosome-binding factor RbfA [Burkholderiales bacterium]|nr:30S ribosome-binding factor RbfA [Pseudomonadota bacterium]
MKSFSRTSRIAEQMQRDLAQVIRTEIKDPRVSLITIQSVDVSPDYSHAKVFFTQLGEAKDAKACTDALNHAAGFLRHHLAERLGLRTMPALRFVYDESVERGIYLSQLIDTAVRSESDPGVEPDK